MYETARRPWGVAKQVCTWCRVERAVGEFWRNPRTGWITKECRVCAEERERLWADVARAPVVVGRRYVDLEGDGPLLCARCGRSRPRALFYTYRDGKSERLYYRPKCKQCMGAEQNGNAARRRDPDRYRSKERDRRLRRDHGIDLAEFEGILAQQGGRCAICRTDNPGGPTRGSAFHVDHCHESGRVRGLLCRACNTALGLLGEDPERFAAAVTYLSNRR